MDLKLNGKTAFVTGSTQGIGYAIAEMLAREGANVIINGRTRKKVDEAVERLSHITQGEVDGVAIDFSSSAEVTKAVDALPKVDILINNVGIFEVAAFGDLGDDAWYRMFEINVMSGVRLSRRFLPEMLKQNWGRIIFIGSESGVNVPANMVHYGASKAALLGLSNGLAKMTRNADVTVNTVLGGPTYSEGVASAVERVASQQAMSVENVKKSIVDNVMPTSLLQRFIQPSELAGMVCFLASPLSKATNGSTIRVDGGLLTTIL